MLSFDVSSWCSLLPLVSDSPLVSLIHLFLFFISFCVFFHCINFYWLTGWEMESSFWLIVPYLHVDDHQCALHQSAFEHWHSEMLHIPTSYWAEQLRKASPPVLPLLFWSPILTSSQIGSLSLPQVCHLVVCPALDACHWCPPGPVLGPVTVWLSIGSCCSAVLSCALKSSLITMGLYFRLGLWLQVINK